MTESAGSYRVMPRPILTEGPILARAVEPGDIERIRRWRNAQIDVLRQSRPISCEEQEAYFERAIWPDKASVTPANILLALVEDGRFAGYGGLVHIAWDHARAEVSFLLDPGIKRCEGEVATVFAAWLRLMKRLAFEDLGLSRLTTETYAMRTVHIRVLEESGFRREGLLRNHVRVGGRSMDALLHACLKSD